jgi:UDP-N-acetylmuramoyl-tripeptide--D-alanyl-D-alanine ligase
MIEGTLSQAAEILHGTLHGGDHPFCGVSTDTRTLSAGQLFFALRGPNYDGEEFIGRAAAARAAGAVACDAVNGQLPVIRVENTRRALGKLAAEWRRRMPARVIGLTGSNGKTTLKELIAACLSLSEPTLATRGNLNNDIGVPLMLSEIAPRHRFAVIEMGANHTGEIAYLTALAMPGIVVITNAAAAHLEGFGNLEAVARAKGEILQGDRRPDWAILNADDRFFSYWKKLASSKVASFGFAAGADFRAIDVTTSASSSNFTLASEQIPGRNKKLEITLPLAGRHNVAHACAAAAVASVFGIDGELIRRGLESATPVAGRLQPLSGIGGAYVYDDSYNANPASVTAAAQFIAHCAGEGGGEGWLVLGDMRELGNDAEDLHRSVGNEARKAGVRRLFATGPLSRFTVESFGSNAAWFEDTDQLARELVTELERNASSGINVLVKGSRSMQMERVVHALHADPVRRCGNRGN